MATTTDESDVFRTVGLGLRTKKQVNYSYLNSNGFDDLEEALTATEAPKHKIGRKRKQSEGDDGPPSKRAGGKQEAKSAPATKKKAPAKTKETTTSKAKKTAPAKTESQASKSKKAAATKAKATPVSKAKNITPAQNGPPAKTPRGKASKAKVEAVTTPKAPTKRAAKPDASKKTSKAATKSKRGNKVTEAAENAAGQTQTSKEVSRPSQEERNKPNLSAESASLRLKAREFEYTADVGAANRGSGPSRHSKAKSPNFSSAPARQFFSAFLFGPGFTIDNMERPYDMSDTSSELSEPPEDLDMGMPTFNDEQAGTRLPDGDVESISVGLEEAAPAALETPAESILSESPGDQPIINNNDGVSAVLETGQGATPSQIVPPRRLGPLGSIAPSIRAGRNRKKVERFGNLMDTTTAVAQDDLPTSSDVEVEQPEEEPQNLSSSDDVDDSSPVPKKKSTKATTRPRKAASTQSKTPRGTGTKRKSASDGKTSSPRPTKRRKPSVVTLQISNGLESIIDSTPATSKKTPRTTKKARNGLLTPESSSQESLDEFPSPEPDPSLINPENQKLHDLSVKLTTRLPLAEKPLPQGQPLVWADSRQALCETTPYFKGFQSGCHSNDGHVYAFLFDATSSYREYVDPDVVISRAGGSMETDKTGKPYQKQNHHMSDSQVRSVMNDAALQNPLVIISGDRHEGGVCKLPHKYSVLGWYKPIAVWGEKTAGKNNKVFTTIKYRFERLDQSKKAWHAPEHDLITDEDRETAGQLVCKTCSHCSKEYPQVYLLGWMCLNPSCAEFWQHYGRDAPYGALAFNPAFLLHRTPWPVEEEPYPIKPPVPDVGNFVGDNLTRINTRGICCPECGRCNSRRLFRGWKCDNPKCTYQNFPKHMPVKVPMLHTRMDIIGDGPALARNAHIEGMNLEIMYMHGFKVYKYTMDGVNGSFMHLVSNAKINREKGGADDMFSAIQDQNDPEMDLHLERRRFGIEKMGGNKAELKKAVEAAKLVAATTQSAPEAGEQSTISIEQMLTSDTSMLDTIQKDASLTSTADATSTPQVTVPTTEQPTESSEETTEVIQDGDFMTAFSMNYGMPYKFVASGASMPFTAAPWPVRAVRADLNWASQTFLDPADHVEFNEELIFAYLQGQKIEYHDDGEEGLGPRIATMSLGGKAKMHLRMKQKHYTGCSKSGILTPEKPISGGLNHDTLYEARLEAWEEVQELKVSNKPLYEKRRKEIPKELGLFANKSKLAPDLVTVTLNHGDIVLMEGYEIQKYLEHKVVPEGCLRFALTCRVVLPEHLKESERPDYEVEGDEEGMSALRRMVAREQELQKVVDEQSTLGKQPAVSELRTVNEETVGEQTEGEQPTVEEQTVGEQQAVEQQMMEVEQTAAETTMSDPTVSEQVIPEQAMGDVA